MGTVDSRAKVFYGSGLVHDDPDEILDADMAPNPGSPHEADEGIAIAFDLGTLSSGDTASFSYVYVLSEDDLDDAMAAMVAPTVDLNGSTSGYDYSTSYTEDSGWKAVVDSDATLTDPDSANLQNLRVTLTNYPDGSLEALTATTSGTSNQLQLQLQHRQTNTQRLRHTGSLSASIANGAVSQYVTESQHSDSQY